ncbi:MAG: hypothetical protein NZ846_09860 [Thermus sp.]|uniref:hypothetical protein n=1 Tax=Thermus sp. TaxID=275 RepID=UPI0025DE2B5D|nr:hypothetical protein [Thermus sp.]MCS7219256.1 hypothetical protein [Thermus sp.]MDW8018182.1 hypothetical protein [Thermus sp.]
MVNKDVGAAYAIARRGLGLKEAVPQNHKKLLQSLNIGVLEEPKDYVSQRVKKVALRKRHLREIDRLLLSLGSGP